MAAWYEIIKSVRDYMRTYGDVKIKTTVSTGGTSAVFKNTTLTTNLKKGNTFTVAGHSQIYVLTADSVNAVSTDPIPSKTGKTYLKITTENTVSFTPPAVAALSADDVVTLGPDVKAAQIDAGNPAVKDTTLTNCAVFILRDSEPDKTVYNGTTGAATFLIRAWTRSDDPDRMAAYEKLSNLESKIDEILIKWHLDGTLSMVTNMEIGSALGDVESFQPSIGSESSFTVKWSKRII